ncbi:MULTISPECIES: GIN domain-containing protein [unclassified Oceanispirochaeta]|uniref:GIN domain-containing protein n=1 Tax=unclassified Oceanispirochaeta TaxID=2635722 RepID=UPI000E09705B|nr:MULTISPECIES: DUF2807 domain-containing protein [unclassified Oceanispirochaeta]MBF9014029.1 DUF2807 domain-containing protein [Oceanispirochaeta sp. M2]NPD70520.1 hypothetical protein [Oceanispirochaeta sp. M1]RDG34288.1 hypothetical protein DV872_00285 [Oceanispirochaeta sp. M1]
MNNIAILLVALTVLPLPLLTALGNPDELVKEGMIIEVDSLDKISTSSDWELIIKKGNTSELFIETVGSSRNYVEYREGELKMGERPGIGFSFKRSRAILTVPELSADLNASSSSDILVNLTVEAKSLNLTTSSSGTIEMAEVLCSSLESKSSSSSKIVLKQLKTDSASIKGSSSSKYFIENGSCRTITTSFSSSSRMLAENFIIEESMNINGSSSSYQEFSINDNIEAKGSLSSTAKLILHGNPSAMALQNIKTSSSGRYEIR